MKEELTERCPNCKDEEPTVPIVNGVCPVCNNTRQITWEAVGKIEFSKPLACQDR